MFRFGEVQIYKLYCDPFNNGLIVIFNKRLIVIFEISYQSDLIEPDQTYH